MSRQPLRQPIPPSSAGYSNLAPEGSTSPISPTFNRAGGQAGTGSPLNPSRGQLYDGPRGRTDDGQGESLSRGSSIDHRGLGTTAGVERGAIGGDYGPYSYDPVSGGQLGGSSRASSLRPPSQGGPGGGRYSTRSSGSPSPFSKPSSSSSDHSNNSGPTGGLTGRNHTVPVWTAKDAELDDKLHNASPHDSLRDRASCTAFSARGWLNMGALVLLIAGLVSLFAGYPIVQYYGRATLSTFGAYGIGGVNASGQVPFIPGLPTLIDKMTPNTALSRTGFDGMKYVLAFSDEFETDGRTFWPGDDPFWEAVDLHYWATGDYEWYDPDAVTTAGGSLVITITEEPIHDLNFRSGMLQSWNKFCFTGGYVEVRVQLPGVSSTPGFWPGVWTMGNLARAGYGSTTDGLWPYSYSTCDIGTLPNQTNVAQTGPQAALTGGAGGTILSYLPGQRLSACTCSGGDHPGPNVGVGRGAPEIDIIEAQVSDHEGFSYPSVSQSAQFAPFDDQYETLNSTPATILYDSAQSWFNPYKGGPYQQAASIVTKTDPTAYQKSGAGFSKYGYEAWPDPTNGYITWSVGDTAAWRLNAASVGPNAKVQIGQRLVSQEPMYLIINLGLSQSFSVIDWGNLVFPAKMTIDYIRVYQREDSPNIGCDPPTMPTADYIARHLNSYMNPNLTTWDAAGYTFPKNKLSGC